MDMNENAVKGKTIYFTGHFELGPQYRAEQLGATIVKSMSEDVDWVVLGRVGSCWGRVTAPLVSNRRIISV